VRLLNLLGATIQAIRSLGKALSVVDVVSMVCKKSQETSYIILTLAGEVVTA